MKKFSLVLFLGLLFGLTNAQWDIIRNEGATDVDFLNDSTGIILLNSGIEGDSSYIARTIDYGETWVKIFEWPLTHILYDVQYVSDSIIFVCGEPNLLMKTTNLGETWESPCIEVTPTFSSIIFISDQIGYGVYGDGMPLCGKTINGGLTWTTSPEYAGRDLFFLDECSGYAPIGNHYYRTTNCGDTWESVEINSINRTATDVHFLSPDLGFIGATGGFGTYFDFNFGSILRTQDGGNSWYILDFPYMPSIFDLVFVNSDVGFASTYPFDGHPYSIIKTADGGTTWGYQNLEIYEGEDYPGIRRIDCPNENLCYAVGTHIYRTTNAGGPIQEGWVVNGIQDFDVQNMTVYPNPVSERIEINLQNYLMIADMHFVMFDISGRIVLEKTYALNKATQEMDLSDLEVGYYILTLKSGTETVASIKILKL